MPWVLLRYVSRLSLRGAPKGRRGNPLGISEMIIALGFLALRG